MVYKVQVIVLYGLLLSITIIGALAQETSADPVSYTMESPEIVEVGKPFSITTVFNIKPEWYVYAPIDMNISQGKIPTKVTFKVPEGIKKIEELKLPDPNSFFDMYHGNGIRMSQRFLVEKNRSQDLRVIKANIVYQACNDYICYPPVSKEVNVVITIE
ncbi:protein-disulfide reductase DsbD domain-containing protein [Flavivirga jejuensis]|uniref:Protein-disulfide reductase DsbD family protein n=1 Tax=Flavivirga jejuensis TaxID=870487 RepID=A0ABT8WVZ4_9FLAO|nr:protein-disulfide reductase DsbD domain-containing protein [Flavivirga jejuensis]MDO5977066.1 protein-disulfide reductase DsbD family protein [Flavivirga jejuensis]